MVESTNNSSISVLSKTWRWLTEPAASVTEPDHRRQARLLATLLLLLVLLGLLTAIEQLLADSSVPILQNRNSIEAVSFTVFLAIAYGLSRTRFHTLAAVFVVFFLSIANFAALFPSRDPENIHWFVYLVLPVLFSSMFLSLLATVTLIIVNIVGMILYSTVFPEISLFADMPVWFFLIVSILILAATRYRDLLAKDQQTKLLQSEETLRVLLNSTNDITFLIDPEGTFLTLNKTVVKLFDMRFDELVGANIYDLFSPDLAKARKARIDKVVASGEPSRFEDEFQGQHFDNSVHPVLDEQGRVTKVAVFIRDITERKHAEEVLNQNANQLRLINEIGGQVAAVLDLENVLDRAVGLMHERLDYQHVSIFIIDRDRGELVMKAGTGSYAAFSSPDLRLKLGEGIVGWVARQGERLLDNDVHAEPHFHGPLFNEMIRSQLSMPIQVSGETVGVLDVQSPHLNAFKESDVTVVETLAGQLAIAIHNAQLYENERGQRVLAEALRDTIAILASTLTFEKVMNRILENVGHVVPHDAANIMLIEGNTARVAYWRGYRDVPQAFSVASPSSLETPMLREMIITGSPVLIPDTASDPGWMSQTEADWVRSYTGVPIQTRSHVIGFLNLNSAKPGFFTPGHAEYLKVFADQAAIAITNAQLFEEIGRYASHLEERVAERTMDLQQAIERLEAILDNSSDAILLTQTDGTIRLANQAFNRMFLYNIDEAFGHPLAELARPDHVETLTEVLGVAREKGQAQRLEFIAQRKDGVSFDVDLAASPIKGYAGMQGFVCSLRNIRELKEVERMKDAFVSNVSHELRTPITSLKLFLGLLQTSPPEEHDELVAVLQRETNRLHYIIEDVLRLSRLDQGQTKLNYTTVDANKLVEEYVTDRKPLAEIQGLSLTLEQQKLPPIQADEGLLGQVLGILLTNALNYAPSGSKVVVDTQSQQMEGKEWVRISVNDTGPGIPPEEQEHLFERFFRGQAGRESGMPGTGLGLAIAQEIVARHRGKIEVESEGVPGKGATFSVWLPTDGR